MQDEFVSTETQTTANDQSVFIEIDALQPNPLQPRGQILPDTLLELAESIREHGILEPLVVAKTPAGYQIIAGERRWRASKLAGLERVPVVIRETSPRGMLEMAIVENVQRVDLNPLERAQAYRKLMDDFSLSAVDIAQRVGKSGSYISNTLRLLELPDALKDGLLVGQISEGHAKSLCGLDNVAQMIQAYKVILKNNLGVRATEELVRRIKAQEGVKPKNVREYVHSPLVEKIENDLTEKLECKVRLSKSSRKINLHLTLRNEEQLNAIYHKLLD
ncbi:MAG: hypothetical protein A3A61_01320 [Candidatus Woykebacteria bacterium RIFCSPLOWO2_01_FULL_43_14]|uniref:ParB-like N-terminal domain-containing protein n=2 Tax=Candidatus Woykeibacteriota TaxID=1817899 RepID=A0A1G1WU96_9BACT|nr:MAG: hypothetical protein A3J50_03470 [Candidatus Woykebacteria bacterium RIFCSPHIGHO2_02_FULL_43_16b]OGY31285.1 MAG: hypothetical protein A3A61_01320 [Candidatus Woykebacteria bacterium RIFCSPLOWO2_01_FULL_43_14]